MPPPNPVQQAYSLGQSIWYDNVRRGLIASGELANLIALGVTGLTSNPSIFEKAIAGSSDYDTALAALARRGLDPIACYESLAVADIQAVCDLLRPVYQATRGVDGYASLEASPRLAHDTNGTVAEIRRLRAAVNRPNAMFKVPATAAGIPAVRQLIAEGVNINVTLIFSRDTYLQVLRAYIEGLESLHAAGGRLASVASVASFFVSRVDTMLDPILERRIAQGEPALQPLLGQAAIANAKLAYQDFLRVSAMPRWQHLRVHGARVQRPLWGSTSTKNPAYRDVLYVETLIGPNTVNTIPPATLTAFLDHGRAALTIAHDTDRSRDILSALARAGITMPQITDTLLADGVKAFSDSFESLLANIAQKREKLLAAV